MEPTAKIAPQAQVALASAKYCGWVSFFIPLETGRGRPLPHLFKRLTVGLENPAFCCLRAATAVSNGIHGYTLPKKPKIDKSGAIRNVEG